MQSNTAVCLTGSVRTLALDCVGPSMLRRIARPLNADLFAFVNVPIEWSFVQANRIATFIREMASVASVRLRMLEVDNESPNSPWPGVAQARGLLRCWETAGVIEHYYWVVRVRTDVYHGFAMPPKGLPQRGLTEEDARVHVGFLGKSGCARSMGRVAARARWVDDRFAVLGGKWAQRLYLHDFAKRLQSERANQSPSRAAHSGSAAHAPECLLGRVFDEANREFPVYLHDVRSDISLLVPSATTLWSTTAGWGATDIRDQQPKRACDHANAIVIRSNCSAETRAAHWTCPPDESPPVLVF